MSDNIGKLIQAMNLIDDALRAIDADEIADHSDLQPAVTLWPSPQVPQFLRKDEQPSDLRMTRGG